MSNNGGSDELTPDQMALAAIAFLAVSLGLIPFGTMFDPVKAWLLESHVLVPAAQAMVELPGTGAGLDLPRILIAAAAAVGILACVVFIVRRRGAE
jgi:hypothetical protein